MKPDVMIIPVRITDGKIARAEESCMGLLGNNILHNRSAFTDSKDHTMLNLY